jgi:hypothetical protein
MARSDRLLTAAALVLAAAALALTWYRLTLGCDLNDEAFSVLVPWRWALGDRPLVDEMDLAQVAGFLSYPFVKAFTLVAGETATGLVLYMRHMYLLFVIGVAAASFLVLRPLVRWQLALAVSLVVVTFVFGALPALTHNTLAMGLLTLGFGLGVQVVRQGNGRRYAALAGLCHGLAVVAFPTLLFVMPFVALFFVLAQGRQARALVAGLTWHVPEDPRPQDGPTGPGAFRTLAAYVGGGLAPVAAVAVVALAAGPRNVFRCWQFTLQAARGLDQLSGAAKAVDVTVGMARFIASQWAVVVALVILYLLYRRWPRLGRGLLVLLPAALYVAGRQIEAEAAGMVLLYGLVAPYLYVLLPRPRRDAAAAVLIWVWPSAVIAAAMTAYTSTDGWVHGAVGLFPAVVVSGLFLAWDLIAAVDGGEGAAEGGARPGKGAAAGSAGGAAGAWLAFAALAAVVAVTISFQFQYQAGGARFAELSARLDAGPWWGVRVTPAQRALLDGYAADLEAQAQPGDALLVYFRHPGLYLYWPHGLATNSVSLLGRPADDPFAPLPESTVAFYRRTRRVPDLVVHVAPTAAADPSELAECGGLRYPVAVMRSDYTVNRRPPGTSTREILDGLPRQR